MNELPAFVDALTGLFASLDEGQINAITSELTLAELLVKPIHDADQRAEANCRSILFGNPAIRVVPVSGEILERAARLRAVSSLKLPDAIHLATAILTGCDFILTNDARFAARANPVEIVLLRDLSA